MSYFLLIGRRQNSVGNSNWVLDWNTANEIKITKPVGLNHLMFLQPLFHFIWNVLMSFLMASALEIFPIFSCNDVKPLFWLYLGSMNKAFIVQFCFCYKCIVYNGCIYWSHERAVWLASNSVIFQFFGFFFDICHSCHHFQTCLI